MTVLILGGIAEARHLAQKYPQALYSLAGRTSSPGLLPLMRRGGFGGIDGLVQYIRDHHITAILNATHPYAARISHHALNAAAITHIPLLRYLRPDWNKQPGDMWHIHKPETMTGIIMRHPRPIWIALGEKGSADWVGKDGQAPWHIRALSPPPLLPGRHIVWHQGGPGDVPSEIDFILKNHISILIARNSGGGAGYHKITAARLLALPVFFLPRPLYSGLSTPDKDTAEQWLAQQCR